MISYRTILQYLYHTKSWRTPDRNLTVHCCRNTLEIICQSILIYDIEPISTKFSDKERTFTRRFFQEGEESSQQKANHTYRGKFFRKKRRKKEVSYLSRRKFPSVCGKQKKKKSEKEIGDLDEDSHLSEKVKLQSE